MRWNELKPLGIFGIGLLALLASISLVQAQHPQDSRHGEAVGRGAVAVAPRREPAAVVDRAIHGTIRHVETHVRERPVAATREFHANQHVFVHRDAEVDIHHQHFWHDFVFGARIHALRAGCVPIFVGGVPYFYDDGIYYQQLGDEYQEVYPPAGAVIAQLPEGTIEIVAGDAVYYYAGGAFYVQQGGVFVLTAPPIGVVVPELPPGAAQVVLGAGVAYQFNGIYYQPVFVNGVTQYMTCAP